MRRSRISKKYSRRLFSKTASRTRKANTTFNMRGGIRM